MTVQQMLAKEGFNNRYNQQTPIYLHEFLYPLMQGYDSVAVKADVELGGTDQKFNIAVGRDLQRYFGQKPQFGVLLPILIGTDGQQKMSKSLDNYVGLTEDALSMYSKLEKTPDSLLTNYFELLTDIPLAEIPSNPREAQKTLAIEVISQYHGKEKALTAQNTALEIVSKQNMANAQNVPEFSLQQVEFPAKLFYILNATNLVKSSGEGRRQIEGGSVRLDGDKVTDANLTIAHPDDITNKILQIGKKKFIRLIP
jgi:tyrosyl-tRNA synthetase